MYPAVGGANSAKIPSVVFTHPCKEGTLYMPSNVFCPDSLFGVSRFINSGLRRRAVLPGFDLLY